MAGYSRRRLIGILAEIGVIFLLFMVGLETKPQDIFKVGKRAVMVGDLGVIFPFVAGYLIASVWGGSFVESMFIGAALVATSVGITARVLGSMGLLERETSRIILRCRRDRRHTRPDHSFRRVGRRHHGGIDAGDRC